MKNLSKLLSLELFSCWEKYLKKFCFVASLGYLVFSMFGAMVIAIYSSDTYQQFDLGDKGISQVIASMWKYYNCLFIGAFTGICMIIVSADLLMMRNAKKQKNK